MKKYYAAENYMSTESSWGFANTWEVLVFSSKQGRDKYVAESRKLACRSIKKFEIPLYHKAAKAFSGQKRVIDTKEKASPFIGIVTNSHADNWNIDQVSL